MITIGTIASRKSTNDRASALPARLRDMGSYRSLRHRYKAVRRYQSGTPVPTAVTQPNRTTFLT